ncbi:hypothetical protein FHS27_006596 [Rhodopirellula rubra]|uniref:Leucine Rich repeats (2 copies) n=1 Tax=Aporhodopirellula rubra TaxID=980271 RepID=A0A7W5E707_9BACT|nr:hypothetical protein [Aporhodopirellula rubra]MBB3210748.1 hypothetical protein [Aporhodopirellula rubra]
MSSTGVSRWQFSIRAILLVMAALGASFSVALIQFRRVQKQSFVKKSVRPIIDKHVSSVGYVNGRIVWLRANDIDPHHPNEFDQWIVPITMNVYINSGDFGPYAAFDNHALRKFATEHPHVRALDLRHSSVTDAGLRHLAKLKQLEWLWLDDSQSTDSGLSYLYGLDALQTIVLELNATDIELVRVLRETLVDCRIIDNSDLEHITSSLSN